MVCSINKRLATGTDGQERKEHGYRTIRFFPGLPVQQTDAPAARPLSLIYSAPGKCMVLHVVSLLPCSSSRCESLALDLPGHRQQAQRKKDSGHQLLSQHLHPESWLGALTAWAPAYPATHANVPTKPSRGCASTAARSSAPQLERPTHHISRQLHFTTARYPSRSVICDGALVCSICHPQFRGGQARFEGK
jgi:hypothetical protein